MINKILDDANEPITVTNLFGVGVLAPTKTLQGVPIGTVGDAVDGELVLKVSIREGDLGSTPGTYVPTVAVVTGNGNVPIGSISWSVTNIDSTNLTVGGAAIPIGATVGGGGYGVNSTLNANLAYTLSNGSALVIHEAVA